MQEFAVLMAHKKIDFHVCGMFSLNLEFVVSVSYNSRVN